MTEDRDKVLCRGEPVKDDIAEGAEIKIRIWTVHVTDEVHAHVTLCFLPPPGRAAAKGCCARVTTKPGRIFNFSNFFESQQFWNCCKSHIGRLAAAASRNFQK